jgi:sugar lactone lactonase YvrE
MKETDSLSLYSLELQEIYPTACSLGEGLFIKNSSASWVDINNNRLFVKENNNFNAYNLKVKPSVIFDFSKKFIRIGSEFGLISFNRLTQNISKYSEKLLPHNINDFRSNDGGASGEYLLLSFMHREKPWNYPGYIYLIKDGCYSLLDNNIFIPNSFIDIGNNQVLISDSLNGEIWKIELDKNGKLVSKNIWHELNGRTGKPDGGCIVEDYIFITLWDGSSIVVLNKNGEFLQNIPLPIKRPTNCKYDISKSQLWVTSASEGLSKEQIEKYPQSGNTFVFKLIRN